MKAEGDPDKKYEIGKYLAMSLGINEWAEIGLPL